MNRLPDMLVLDFCEYLSRRRPRNGITVFELLADEANRKKLGYYAKEYLSNRLYSFKVLLQR